MKQEHSKQRWEGTRFERGQALVTLLFFTVIGTTVTFAAVMMIIANSLSGMKFQQGSIAYEIAQSGAENAKLRLLRDPTYIGETITVGSGSAVITVTSNAGNTYTIISKGVQGSFVRQIQVDATYANNLFQVTSQKEIF